MQVIQTQSGPNIAEKVRVMIKHKFECIQFDCVYNTTLFQQQT